MLYVINIIQIYLINNNNSIELYMSSSILTSNRQSDLFLLLLMSIHMVGCLQMLLEEVLPQNKNVIYVLNKYFNISN